MEMTCRVLVVDPCPIVARGLESVFRGSEFSICHHTSSARDAIEWIFGKDISLIVCDFELTDGTSLEIQNAADRQNIPMVMLSSWQNPVFVSRMAEAGTLGLINKSSGNDEILALLRKVAAGKSIWKRQEVRRVTGALATPRLESHIDCPLTQREFEVLDQLATGQTNKMIAEKLGISYETVKEHVQHVLLKLGVGDRTQAAVFAVRRGLL